jgi:hypothetical protein
VGLTVALLTLVGVAVTGCSDDGPSSPAISGNSPGEVSVPTVPTTPTETTVPGTTAGADSTTTTAAP